MKKVIPFLVCLLSGAGAFAQEYADQSNVSRTVGTGTIRDEKAVVHLTATNAVERGATAHYTAGQSITLQPGFVAQAGSVFGTTIGPVDSRRPTESGTVLTVRAFPNPVESTVTVEYGLPEALRVNRTLTDAAGQIIRRSGGQEVESAGTHRTLLDLTRLPAGVYLYQIETGNGSKILRLIKR